jgi:4'-phosphopantetheinyl transferase EntD
VGVAVEPVTAEAWAALAPEEREHAHGLGAHRRLTWVAGRLALRAALAELGVKPEAPLLADAHGAPLLPMGVAGSISHKRTLAVALVAAGTGFHLGVDLEEDRPLRWDISRRVLTGEEMESLRPFAQMGPQRDRAVLVRFSLKESVYKAVHPVLRRPLSFKEAQVLGITTEGRATLKLLSGPTEPRLDVEGWVHTLGGHVLTTVRAQASGGVSEPQLSRK